MPRVTSSRGPHEVRIEPMTAADVGVAAELLRRGAWGEREAFFAFAVGSAACRPFVARRYGRILGTAVGTANGPVGWVGTVFVAEPERRRGLGLALTETVLEALDAAACPTVVLVATDAGRPLYERLGFEIRTEYRTFAAPGLPAVDRDRRPAAGPPAGSSVPRRFRPDDLGAAMTLDRLATGEDRRHLLEAFSPIDGSLVHADPAGDIDAFLVRAPWGGGATIARSPEVALALLDERRRQAGPDRRVRAGLPRDHASACERLLGLGWTEGWRARRMERGPRVAWRPEMIWGQFSMAVG